MRTKKSKREMFVKTEYGKMRIDSAYVIGIFRIFSETEDVLMHPEFGKFHFSAAFSLGVDDKVVLWDVWCSSLVSKEQNHIMRSVCETLDKLPQESKDELVELNLQTVIDDLNARINEKNDDINEFIEQRKTAEADIKNLSERVTMLQAKKAKYAKKQK